jgi:hypothetical protein
MMYEQYYHRFALSTTTAGGRSGSLGCSLAFPSHIGKRLLTLSAGRVGERRLTAVTQHIMDLTPESGVPRRCYSSAKERPDFPSKLIVCCRSYRQGWPAEHHELLTGSRSAEPTASTLIPSVRREMVWRKSARRLQGNGAPP